ncbi:MAG: hypothetical protein LUG13_09960 [Oscillospiraceae bacterium]|nr:hypothetical protein [Oscillospiraceae bacterium]
MSKTLFRIFGAYWKWRGHWDDLCNRCGLCCYTRSVSDSGEVIIDLSSPCKFLNEETHLCSVFQNRFHEYHYCGSVNMYHALFNPAMPPNCAYVKTFRLWKNQSAPVQADDGHPSE